MCQIFICLKESVPEICNGEATEFKAIHYWKVTTTTDH